MSEAGRLQENIRLTKSYGLKVATLVKHSCNYGVFEANTKMAKAQTIQYYECWVRIKEEEQQTPKSSNTEELRQRRAAGPPVPWTAGGSGSPFPGSR